MVMTLSSVVLPVRPTPEQFGRLTGALSVSVSVTGFPATVDAGDMLIVNASDLTERVAADAEDPVDAVTVTVVGEPTRPERSTTAAVCAVINTKLGASALESELKRRTVSGPTGTALSVIVAIVVSNADSAVLL